MMTDEIDDEPTTAPTDAAQADVADDDRDATSDASSAPATRREVRWAPPAPIRKGYGGSALSFALAGLVASFFVGWAFPLALVGIALGIFAIRKREESTTLGVWGVCLGTLAVIYSVGWLLWAARTLHWFGW